ncbi:MAG: ClpXP protease specificity-enhancing factor [Pseudomonadota bacterium]|nr:ClpXP protease specificity-enhancing factor [Pseudomonadota bacterium]
MTSQRPYLLRAMHEWISDNGMTPYLLVNAHYSGVHVPAHTVKDGQVVLNIAERAVQMLSLGNEYITFNARFAGVSHEVFVPVGAVLAIYARETGQGMGLPPEPEISDDNEADSNSVTSATAGNAASAAKLVSVPSSDDGGDEPPSNTPTSTPKRAHLRVVE